MTEDPNNRTVPVVIQNWPDEVAKPTYVKKTTLKTWILDTVGAAGPAMVPICDYEPRRCRLAILVVDNPVALTTESPVHTPDTSTVSVAPQGLHLAANTAFMYEFHGPDAMWLNIIGPGPATTRVLVIREYH